MAVTRAKKVKVLRQLKHCPACGYTEGFHVMFTRRARKSTKLLMSLICPMCAKTFDLGIRADTGEED